jgi:hypothetical protein
MHWNHIVDVLFFDVFCDLEYFHFHCGVSDESVEAG